MAATRLPLGYSARPASIDDAAAAADLLRIAALAEGGRPGWTEDDLANWWGNEYFAIDEDVLLVSTEDGGALVGVEMVAHSPPHVLAICIGGVHPDHCGRGIGTAMVRWGLERARERVSLAPEGSRVELHCYVFADHRPSVELLTGLGLSHLRFFVDMEVDFDEPPERASFPEGVDVRAFAPGTDDVAAWRMMNDAFRDHFGHVPIGEEEGVARLRQRRAHPEFDPSLWWLAEADGALVGGVWAEPSFEGDPDVGYIATLGVVREWRRRGLGRALLLHSFRQLYDMGKTRAALGVDASSLTGATMLYESVGMHVAARFASYDITLRDGHDLKTTSLD